MASTTAQLLKSLGGFDCETAFTGILDSTWIGVLVAAVDGQVVYANAAYGRMSGYDRHELLALRLENLVHADDLHMFHPDAHGGRMAGRHTRKDGTVLPTLTEVSLQSDRLTGRPLFLVIHLLDLSERQSSLEHALAEKERLAMTLRSIADAVICTDTGPFITFMNPAAELATGWTASEAVGRRLAEVFRVVEEEDTVAVDPVSQCLSTGTRYIRERGILLRARSGEIADIGLSVAPVGAPGGDVTGSVIVFNDVTDVRAQEKKIAHCALHDELTGLANRTKFLAELRTAVHRARVEARTHVLCFIDLDRFKTVNDRGGHAAGDALLAQAAAIISRCCAPSDVPARLGGDEFVLLMLDRTLDDATAAANRITRAIGSMQFRWQGQSFRITASLGAAMITGDSPQLSEILHQADKACCAAKESGRNRVCVYRGARPADPRAFGATLPKDLSRRMRIH